MATTIAHMASKLDMKTKKVHFRISGQFQETNDVFDDRVSFDPSPLTMSKKENVLNKHETKYVEPGLELFFCKCLYECLLNKAADVASGTLIPMPELLPDDELVSTLASSLQRFAEVLLSLSLSMHGVSGCEKVSGVVVPFVLDDSSGQMEASSSGRNVDTDGDSMRVRGNSTSKRAGSVEMPIVFMAIDKNRNYFKISFIVVVANRPELFCNIEYWQQMGEQKQNNNITTKWIRSNSSSP
ncbi:hypothetical protein FF38_10445 [Lucilia cuprina]|uniref:Uncharacterized protein n=1 Tax=Lucilia cuprina TaxID=7375 RepID=A0A0L0CBK1_LUCCU|nr:hypothetical protein FF38_10445 [Lucilia cuprina]